MKKMMAQITKHQGFTLIELMISMAIGLIITAGAISMFTSSLKSSYDFVALTKLDQDLQGVMDLIAKEVRRAGYDSNINIGSDTEFGISNASTSNCLLYTYDDNTSGTIGQLDTNENYGIRLNNNQVFFGSSVTTCGGSGWGSINDNAVIEITNLTFVQNNLCLNLENGSDCVTTTATSGDQLLWKKQINIVVAGNYTNDSSNYTHRIENTIRLHNDLLQTAP